MEIDLDQFRVQDRNGKSYILESYQSGISGLVRFMKQVIDGDQPAFVLKKGRHLLRNGEYIRASALANHFRALHSYSGCYQGDWEYSPELRLFFEEYRRHPIRDCFLRNQNVPNAESTAEAVVFDEFIRHLRERAKATDLKRRMRDWSSGSRNNEKSLKGFLSRLFRRYARLMVVRLDFNYHAAIFSPEEVARIYDENELSNAREQMAYLQGEDLGEPRPTVGRIALEEVLRDKDRLFANRRGNRRLFENLVGYVWRVEFTPKAGYHLHVALVYDGSHVRKHEWLAQQVGEYFENDITNGRAYHHNCNRDREEHGDAWALGAIDHWDTAKRENLINALGYLAKDDQRVKVKPHRKCRMFGAVIVNRDQGTRSGRRRSRVAELVLPKILNSYRINPFGIKSIG